MLEAYFDGSITHNPGGHATCACIIERDGEIIAEKSCSIGHGPAMTCNVAEYHGLMYILRWYTKFCRQNVPEPLVIHGDSQVVIRSMNRRKQARVKPGRINHSEAIRELCLHKLSLLQRDKIIFTWIPREQNKVCDAMCRLEQQKFLMEQKRQELVVRKDRKALHHSFKQIPGRSPLKNSLAGQIVAIAPTAKK